MRYLALACDYDGTIAHHGHVDEPTLAALERFRASGRKLILVTGRRLDDLFTTFPHAHLFERLVVENGALLYQPDTREERPIAPPPPPELVLALQERGVAPMDIGRSILATWEPHEVAALAAIRDLGLEWQVIFNKGAVMLLPPGVNKASGLTAALKELGLSPHNVVAVGDAENDSALLQMSECSAAVANALPTILDHADIRTANSHGAGVAELIDQILADDLAPLEGRLVRHHLLLGLRPDGTELKIPPYDSSILLAGPSASGKSTIAAAFMERLVEHRYQFCAIDPEGDYEGFKDAMVLGESQRPPTVGEVLRLLAAPEENAVVNLVGLPLADRPGFFQTLLPALLEMRARTGRPHWIILDEAHQLLPVSWQPAGQALDRVLMITAQLDQVALALLGTVNTMIATGQAPAEPIRRFCTLAGREVPSFEAPALSLGEVLVWRLASDAVPFPIRVVSGKSERFPHK